MKTAAPLKTHRLLDLKKLTLAHGSHKSADDGMCILEAVSFMAGETFGDHPKCACPVISAMLRSWNDRLNTEDRQQLKRYILPLVGSKSTRAVEIKRGYLAADWAIRIATPIALRAAKLDTHAEALEKLPEIIDVKTRDFAWPVIVAARDAARKARRNLGWPWYRVEAAAVVAAAAVAAVAVAVAAVEAEAVEAEAVVAAVAVAAVEAVEAVEAEAVEAVEKIRADLTVSAHDLAARMLAVKE
jgi:hypothetical protein